jgi:hypothetical protein
VTQNQATLAEANYLDVEVAQFMTSTGDQELPEGAVVGYAQVLGGGSRVKLHVCFDRSSQKMGAPGLYVGTVNIVDPRVARLDVPFSVSLSYPIWQYVLAIYVSMLLPATLYVWLLLGSFKSADRLSMEKFQRWFFSRNAIIALGTGFAVSIGLLLGTYFKAEAWGTSVTEATALFGACFSAFVAAAAGVTAASTDTGSSNAMP